MPTLVFPVFESCQVRADDGPRIDFGGRADLASEIRHRSALALAAFWISGAGTAGCSPADASLRVATGTVQ
jgi:hypothetical protein